MCIGPEAYANSCKFSVVIGYKGLNNNLNNNSLRSISIGAESSVISCDHGIVIGNKASASNATNSVVIGNEASASNATNSVVIGNDAKSTHAGSVVIGNGAISTEDDNIKLGSSVNITSEIVQLGLGSATDNESDDFTALVYTKRGDSSTSGVVKMGRKITTDSNNNDVSRPLFSITERYIRIGRTSSNKPFFQIDMKTGILKTQGDGTIVNNDPDEIESSDVAAELGSSVTGLQSNVGNIVYNQNSYWFTTNGAQPPITNDNYLANIRCKTLFVSTIDGHNVSGNLNMSNNNITNVGSLEFNNDTTITPYTSGSTTYIQFNNHIRMAGNDITNVAELHVNEIHANGSLNLESNVNNLKLGNNMNANSNNITNVAELHVNEIHANGSLNLESNVNNLKLGNNMNANSKNITNINELSLNDVTYNSGSPSEGTIRYNNDNLYLRISNGWKRIILADV